MSRSQIAALAEQRTRDLNDIAYLTQETARAAEQRAALEAEARALAESFAGQNALLQERANSPSRKQE